MQPLTLKWSSPCRLLLLRVFCVSCGIWKTNQKRIDVTQLSLWCVSGQTSFTDNVHYMDLFEWPKVQTTVDIHGHLISLINSLIEKKQWCFCWVFWETEMLRIFLSKFSPNRIQTCNMWCNCMCLPSELQFPWTTKCWIYIVYHVHVPMWGLSGITIHLHVTESFFFSILPVAQTVDRGLVQLLFIAMAAEDGMAPTSGPTDKPTVCVKCSEETPTNLTLSAGRSGRICKLCYNSQRSLADHFRKRGQKQQWDSMPAERKKRLIVENKHTGGVRGRERHLKITDEASELGSGW